MKSMRGAALVTTVWLVALATILAMNFSLSARGDTAATNTARSSVAARAIAEAGLWRAVYELEHPTSPEPWARNGRATMFSFAGESAEIVIQDLGGLLDLNVASAEIMTPVFSYLLGDPERAKAISDAIIDWRDRDTKARPFGAEDVDYRAAGVDYEAKDGPFNTREELQLLLDIAPAEYRAIAPYVTVYSQRRKLDTNVVPLLIQNALQLNTSTSGTSTRLGAKSRGGSGNFEILVKAKVGSAVYKLAAVVTFKSGRRTGAKVAILDWRESWPFELPLKDPDENPPVG